MMARLWQQWLPLSALALTLSGCDLEALTGLVTRPPITAITAPRPTGNAVLSADRAGMGEATQALINTLPAQISAQQRLELPSRSRLMFPAGPDPAASLQVLVLPPLGSSTDNPIFVGDDAVTPLAFSARELGCEPSGNCLTPQPLTLIPRQSRGWYLLTYIFVDTAANSTVIQRFVQTAEAAQVGGSAQVVSDRAGLAAAVLPWLDSLPSSLPLSQALVLPSQDLDLPTALDRDRALRIRIDPPLNNSSGFSISAADLGCTSPRCRTTPLTLLPSRSASLPQNYLLTFTFTDTRGNTSVIQRFLTVTVS